MAEVTRAKPPSFSSHCFAISSSSSSSKHIYDDVFASTPPRKLKSSQLSSFGDDDYGEIFGSSKSDNGVWESPTSSIPVFNLPESEHRVYGSRGRGEGGDDGGDFDYLGVFGGIGDDNSLAFPNGEEVFDHLKKKAKTSVSTYMPRREEQQTREAAKLHPSRPYENDQKPSREFDQSIDSQRYVHSEPNDMTQAAHIHVIPASSSPSHEVGPSQKVKTSSAPMIKEEADVEIDTHMTEEENSSAKLGAYEQKGVHDVSLQKPSCLSESISTSTSYENHQASTAAGPAQVQKSEAKDDLSAATPGSTSLHEIGIPQEIQINRKPTTKCIAEQNIDAELSRKTSSELERGEVTGSTSSELSDNECRVRHDTGLQKASGLSESISVAASCDSCQASTVVGSSTVVNDHTKLEFDVKYTNTDVRSSTNEQNGENDAVFQKVSGLNGLKQNVTSHDTSQDNYEAGSSNLVKDEIDATSSFDMRKKHGRHARMTSVDLGGRKNASQADAGSNRKSHFGSSHSFDASHDPFAAHIKLHPSKVVPSASLPQFFPVENHCKISENSSDQNSENNPYGGSGGLPSSFDEQLDVNSVAAISAAALQKAIKEAEMKIHLAKQFLEREGQGNIKLSFKDTLKRKVGKENSNANERSEYQHKNIQHRPQVERMMQNYSYSDRKSVLQTTQVAPCFEGQKKFLKDEELMDANVSKLTEDGDKCDGGEWEATKHLNQLISGVKNKIASFMTWQAETEKKEEPKETEAKSRAKPELKDAEVFEMKETEINQYDSVFAYKTKGGESKPGLISEAIKPDENELMQSNTVQQEKAGHFEDVVPRNKGPNITNFLSFTFSNEKSWGFAHPKGVEKKKTEGSGELGFENGQNEGIDKLKEQIQDKNEEASQEDVDNNCPRQDSGNSYQSSNISEGDVIVDDPYSTCEGDGCFRTKFTYDENSERKLNEKCGDDRNDFIHADNHDSKLSEGCEDAESEFTCQGKGKPSEELDKYKSKYRYQEKEMITDEYRDNKRECNHEEEGRMDEECGGDQSKFTYQKSRSLSAECRRDCDISGHEDSVLSEEPIVDRSHTTHEGNNNGEKLSECGNDQSDFTHEGTDSGRMNMDSGEEPINSYNCPETIIMAVETDNEREEYGEVEEAEDQIDNGELLNEADLLGRIGKRAEAVHVIFQRQKDESDKCLINDIEEFAEKMDDWEENKSDQKQFDHAEETENKVTELDCTLAEDEYKQTENKVSDQVDCVSAGDKSKQTEHEFLAKAEEICGMDRINSEVEEIIISDEENEMDNFCFEPEMDSEIVSHDEEGEKMKDTTHTFSEPEKDTEIEVVAREVSEFMGEERVLMSSPIKYTTDFPGILHLDGIKGAVPCENFVSHQSETDFNCGQNDLDGKGLESKSEEILENQTEYLNESLDSGNVFNVADHVHDNRNFEAVHRRRRWFESSEKVGNGNQHSILEGRGVNLEIDEEELEESDLYGTVEVHGDKSDMEASRVTTGTGSGRTLDQDESGVNVEATPKRRRWFVNTAGEGILKPQTLFSGIKVVTSEMDPEIVNESELHTMEGEILDHLHSESGGTLNSGEGDVVVNEDKSKHSVEATPRRKRWFEEPNVDINQEHKAIGESEKSGEGKDDMNNKTEPENEVHTDLSAMNRKKKEKEKERIAVERAIREARERAFAEARERARRDAAERPTIEAKASSETTSASDKASMEAKLRAERAAVERATAEARERALQKALSEKAFHRLREPAGRHQPERSSSFDPKYHSSSSNTRCSDSSSKGDKIDGGDGESVQRRKARMERQNRTMERAAKALEEKNKRDIQAQKEQTTRNMFADTLDAEVKRWASGKAGNLRALLSTLQYILGSDSGWQAISLTDLVAPTAVRKAYKKATLCVHPDKLQQRGATIQQKYICEKVFDLLKEAWSKFNPDDR